MMNRLGKYLLLALLGLILVIFVKTLTFSSRQIPVQPVTPAPTPTGAVSRLSQAVQIPTISYFDKVDTSAFEALDSLILLHFPLVDSILQLERINQFARAYTWQGKNARLEPILLTAHMDVVPAEGDIATNWEHPPFSGAVTDEFIWGRGTMDDKVSVFAILEATEQLLAEGYVPERSIYFGFGHDEEVSGINGAQALASYFKSKGLHFEYVLDEGLLIVEEAVPGLDPPLALIGISEKGYATFRLTAKLEKGGHSSMPDKATAIGILSTAVHKLEHDPFPAKLQGTSRLMLNYLGPETNFPFNAVFANLWLTSGILKSQFSAKPSSNAILRTTTAPTIIEGGVKENVLPTQASCLINFRILPGETIETVKERIEQVIDDPRITVALRDPKTAHNPSPVSSVESFGFQVIQKSIREIFPEVVVAPGLMVAFTDVRNYTEVSDDQYRFLPLQVSQEDLKRLHGFNERVSVKGYQRAISWYRQLIINSSK